MDAALTGLLGVVVGAAATLIGHIVDVRIERTARMGELVVSAFDHFQGSQRRSAGIASLQVLRNDPLWSSYRLAVLGLFVSQLRYLFAHASNRWESHEVWNIREMMGWLMEEGERSFLAAGHGHGLSEVMERYEREWRSVTPRAADTEYEDGGRPDVAAVEDLITRFAHWQDVLRKASPRTIAGAARGSKDAGA